MFSWSILPATLEQFKRFDLSNGQCDARRSHPASGMATTLLLSITQPIPGKRTHSAVNAMDMYTVLSP